LPATQLSDVQGLLSSQSNASDAWHLPPEQVSPTVHASPSSQAAELCGWMHPTPLTQLSTVQGLSSSQSVLAPDWHAPPEQKSPAVHASPSSQDPPIAS